MQDLNKRPVSDTNVYFGVQYRTVKLSLITNIKTIGILPKKVIRF